MCDLIKITWKLPVMSLLGLLLIVMLVGQTQSMAQSTNTSTVLDHILSHKNASGLMVSGFTIPSSIESSLKYTPSKEYLDYANAPKLTQEQKDEALKIASKSPVYKQYIQYPHGQFTFTWSYPYTGKILLYTGINSTEYNGLLMIEVDNDNVTSAGFKKLSDNEVSLVRTNAAQPINDASTQLIQYPYSLAMCALNDRSHPNSPKAVDATNGIVGYWNSKGLNPQILWYADDTKSNVLNYWSNDGVLGYINNIGHAMTGWNAGDPCYGIAVSPHDGTCWVQLSDGDVSSMGSDAGIRGSCMFVCSCNSFSDPWKSAICNHQPWFFIGAQKVLWSNCEPCNQQFWNNYLNNHQTVSQAITNAISSTGENPGEFTFWGHDDTL